MGPSGKKRQTSPPTGVKSLIHYFKRVGPQRRSSLEVEVIQSSSNVRGREAQNVSSNTTEEKPRQQPHAKRRRVDGDDDGESTPPMHPSPEESAGCESSDASPIVETVLTDIESPNPSAAIGSEKEPHVPMDVDVAEHETIVDANPDHVSGDEAAESTAVDGAGSNTKDGTSDTLSDTGKGSLNAPEMEVEVDSGAPSPEGMSHSDRLPLQGSSSKENSPHSHERSAIGGRRMMVTLSSLKVPATPVRGKSSGDESVSKKTPAVSPIRQRVGLRNSYMVTRSKGKTSKTMSSSLSSDDEDLCAKKVVEDSSDDDLMAPVPFGLGTDSRGERRSGRNRGAINYAEPPLDPFKDRVLLESAKKVGRLSTSVKKPMFSLDVLLRDKKKRDAKQTEVNKLLEALKTMEDKEDSTSVDPLDDADLRAELSDEADDAIREYLKQPKTSKKMISYLAAIDISQDLVFKQKDPPATLPVTWRKALQESTSDFLFSHSVHIITHKRPENKSSIMRWLFDIVSYHPDPELARRAYHHFRLESEDLSLREWQLSIEAFKEALGNLGAPVNNLKSLDWGKIIRQEDPQPKEGGDAHEDDIFNRIRLVTLMIAACAKQQIWTNGDDLVQLIVILTIMAADRRVRTLFVDDIGDALAELLGALSRLGKNARYDEAIGAELANIGRGIPFVQFQLVQSLFYCACLTPNGRETRRVVARKIILSLSDKPSGGSSEHLDASPDISERDTNTPDKSFAPILAAVRASSIFNPSRYAGAREDQDYIDLGAMVQILSVAVGVLEDMTGQTKFASQLASHLRTIYGNISDPRAAFLERTRAKHELLTLSTWLRSLTPVNDAFYGEAQTKLSFSTPAPSNGSKTL